MTTEYVTLKKTMTVKQAMNHIKDIGIHKETIYTCYVTENKKLIGIVTAKSLMTSDDDENITNLMNTTLFLYTLIQIRSRLLTYLENMT